MNSFIVIVFGFWNHWNQASYYFLISFVFCICLLYVVCFLQMILIYIAESTLSEQGELKPLSTSPEQQESASSSSKGSNSSQLQPLMSILGGVATALILVSVVIVVTMRLRCGGGRRDLHGSSSHDHTWKTDSGENSSVDLQAVDHHQTGVLLRNSSPGEHYSWKAGSGLVLWYGILLYVSIGVR